MMFSANSFKLRLLLFLMLSYSMLNLIYQLSIFTGIIDGIVGYEDITESFVDLISKIFILAGLLTKTLRGWWFAFIVAVLSVVFVIPITLLSKTGDWVHLYLFVVVYIFSWLLHLLSSLAITEKYIIKPSIALKVELIYKLYYSIGIAFLFMFIFGNMVLSLFVATLLFIFLTGAKCTSN